MDLGARRVITKLMTVLLFIDMRDIVPEVSITRSYLSWDVLFVRKWRSVEVKERVSGVKT